MQSHLHKNWLDVAEDYADNLLNEDCPGHSEDEEKKMKNRLCSNCCSPFDLIDSVGHNPYNKEVEEMLSSIYKLNYLNSSENYRHHNCDDNNSEVSIRPRPRPQSPLVLCPSCGQLLQNLYSLFCQFNQIRQLNSQLAKEIQAVNRILINSQQSSDHNYDENENGAESKKIKLKKTAIKKRREIKWKHPSFSRMDGPWVSLGSRLEQLDFEQIGYKPRISTSSFDCPDFVQSPESKSAQNCDDDNYDPGNVIQIQGQGQDVKLFMDEVSSPPSSNETRSQKSAAKFTTLKFQKSKSNLKKAKSKSKFFVKTEEPDSTVINQNQNVEKSSQLTAVSKKDRRNERRRHNYRLYQSKSKGKSKVNSSKVTDAEMDTKCVVVGCGMEFEDHEQLRKHEREHASKKDGPYLCNLPILGGGPPCKSTFRSIFFLKRHQLTSKHKEPDVSVQVRCEECGTVLKDRGQYNIHFYHMHTEKGRKRYEEEQKKVLEQQRKERAEERQMMQVKGYICHVCQIDFQTKILLTKHRIDEHEDFGSRYKPYVCEICGKKCLGLYRLNQHVTTVHSDERRWICSTCGKSYKTVSQLNGHMKISHNEEGRLKFNEYCRESNRRRKALAEALARKVQESHNINPQVQMQREEEPSINDKVKQLAQVSNT